MLHPRPLQRSSASRSAERMLKLGTTESGDPVSIRYKDRAAHLHTIGRSRSGKSRFLASLIKQDILAGQGLCLLDPHGEMYDYLVDWLTTDDAGKAAAKYMKIRPVQIADPDSTFLFNPLKIDHPEEAVGVAGIVADAFTKIYGGNDPNSTPLITDTITKICMALANQGLPLMAAEPFITYDQIRERQTIVESISDPYLRRSVAGLTNLTKRQFDEEITSTTRRLNTFFHSPICRRVFSATKGTIDVRHAMDHGEVLLFDLRRANKRIGTRELRAFGTFMVNTIWATAQERDPNVRQRPFHLYIDEAQNFISDDIGNILAEAAKYGLFLTLSHQYLHQLSEAGEKVYHGVMSCALLKAVFGVTHAEAMILADELFAERVDLQRVKEKIQTPTVVGHRIRNMRGGGRTEGSGVTSTDSTSEATAHNRTDAYGTAQNNGTSLGSGTSEGTGLSAADPNDLNLQDAQRISQQNIVSSMENRFSGWSDSSSSATGHSEAFGKASAWSESQQHASSESWSETLEPLIEMLSLQTYTLEEQRYELATMLSTQKPRNGHFCAIGRGTLKFRSLETPDLPTLPIKRQKTLRRLQASCSYIIPTSELELDAPYDSGGQSQPTLLEAHGSAKPSNHNDNGGTDPFDI